MEGFLGAADEKLAEAMDASGYAIEDPEFREEMEEGLKGARLGKGCPGDIVWPAERAMGLERVQQAVAEAFGVKVADLRFHGHRHGRAKAAAVELRCQLTGKTQREIARHFGFGSESSVGKVRKRLAA